VATTAPSKPVDGGGSLLTLDAGHIAFSRRRGGGGGDVGGTSSSPSGGTSKFLVERVAEVGAERIHRRRHVIGYCVKRACSFTLSPAAASCFRARRSGGGRGEGLSESNNKETSDVTFIGTAKRKASSLSGESCCCDVMRLVYDAARMRRGVRDVFNREREMKGY
jgi:hypothetical protein